MRKDKRQELGKLTDEIGDFASKIDSEMEEISFATDEIFKRLRVIDDLLADCGGMTVEDVMRMIKLYRRMRQAQKEGDDTLVDIILEQIDALVEE